MTHPTHNHRPALIQHMEHALPSLRNAKPGDAAALAALAERTFRDTFGAMYTAEAMDLHCRQSYGATIQAAEIADPARVTLVFETAGELIAYAQLRWGEAPPCVSGQAPGEIQRLYVAHDWHGKGLAQQLMQACLDEMEKRGNDVVWLGVWEKNPRAIAFYQKFGFIEVGDHSFALGGDTQRDIVMARPLAGAR